MHDVQRQVEIQVQVHPRSVAALTTLPSSGVPPVLARSRLSFVVAGLVLTTLAFLVMLATKPGGSALVIRVSDVTTVAAAAAASIACAVAGRRQARSMRQFWWLLAAASAAWTCGEAIWTWYEVVLRAPVPYPSWADVAYLAGTPLAVAAFACHPATRLPGSWRIVPMLNGLAFACALLFVTWTLILGALWNDAGGLSVGAVVSITYPFGDVVMLVLIVLALRNLQSGHRPATVLLLGGLLVMAASDIVYTYLTLAGHYASGDLIDTGWFAAYLAIGAAALVYESSAQVVRPVPARSPLMAVLATNLPVLVALAIIPIQVIRRGDLDRIAWGIALCLVVIVLLGQLLDLLQRRAADRYRARPSVDLTALSRPRVGPGAIRTIGLTAQTRAQVHELTLEMSEATRVTAQERVQRVSHSTLMVLMPLAGVLSLWDLSLLVHGAA